MGLRCCFHVPKDAREAQTGRFPSSSDPATKGEGTSARSLSSEKEANQISYSQDVVCVRTRTMVDESSDGATPLPITCNSSPWDDGFKTAHHFTRERKQKPSLMSSSCTRVS